MEEIGWDHPRIVCVSLSVVVATEWNTEIVVWVLEVIVVVICAAMSGCSDAHDAAGQTTK